MELSRYRTAIRLLLSIEILFQGCYSDVSCRNDDGDEVDWYILYKFPNVNGAGLQYLYIDEHTNGWTQSTKAINSISGTLANTLKPLLDFYDRQTEGFAYLLYSDQNEKTVSSYGHSKGVVMLDRKTGIWLSHSTPKFPTYRSKDFWPNSGNANAQMFMCVTYSYNIFKEIGLQLKYIYPYPYDFNIPKTFPVELRDVAQGGHYPKKAPWFRETTLTSVSGRQFRSFAKYKRFGDDLYSGLIAKGLKQHLYAKSWGRMRQPQTSNCSIPQHVYNVKQVKLAKRQPFSDTVDHSKWCVTSSGHWTCITDMNREISQMSRGGGGICTDDVTVFRAFNSSITEVERCKEEHTHSNAQRREL